MILVDVNLLISATMSAAPDHQEARSWWGEQLRGTARVGLPWISLAGFVRVAAQSRAWERPMPVVEALATVRYGCHDHARGYRSLDRVTSTWSNSSSL